MAELSDENNMSDQASTSKLPEEKVGNKGNDKACEVEKTEETTKVADNQDLVGKESLPKKRSDEGLTLKPSEKSFPQSTHAVLSTFLSGQPEAVDTTSESSEKSKQDKKKIEKGKADVQIAPLFEGHRITILESFAPPEPGEEMSQSKEFTKQGSMQCLDVISPAAQEFGHVRAVPVELQPSVPTTEDLNEKMEEDGEMEEEKEEDEKVPLLGKEKKGTAIQDGGPTEPGERVVENREESEEVKINVPSTVQHSDVEMVDVSAKDLLSFSWQIAKGMVGVKFNTFRVILTLFV